MVRTNKEIKIGQCDNFIMKYGTTNRIKPEVIYVVGTTWVSSKYDGNFPKTFEIMRNRFNENLKKMLKYDNIFGNKYVLDFDVRPNKFKIGKKKILRTTIFLKQKNNDLIGIKQLKNTIIEKFKYLFKELEDDLIYNDFELSAAKKNYGNN